MQRVIGFRRQLLARQYKHLPIPQHLRCPTKVGLRRLKVEVRGIYRLIDNLALCRRCVSRQAMIEQGIEMLMMAAAISSRG